MTSTTTKASPAMRAIPPMAAALFAFAVSLVEPLLGPLLVALVIGATVANTPWATAAALRDHEMLTRTMLRVGVVLLGLKLPLNDVLAIGAPGAVTIVATVVGTFIATKFVGVRLGLDERFVTLLAAGFSICGAAAIAAVNDAVKARQRDVALAVALVTLFGSAMIVLLPWGSRLLGLTETQSAIWAGASVHEVAQVLATASVLGTGAIALATTIKLGRVALLAPTYLMAARKAGGPVNHVPLVPWFVIGFAVMIALRSLEILPLAVLTATNHATTIFLAAGMFGLGLGLRLKQLLPVPLRAIALAAFATVVAATFSLGLVMALY